MTDNGKCLDCITTCEKCILAASLSNSIKQVEELKKFYLEQITSVMATQDNPKVPDRHNLN